MREDILLEDIITYIGNIIKSIGKVLELRKGMWQTKEEGKYPDDKGFRYTARFFIILAVLLAIPSSLILYVQFSIANAIFLISLLYSMIFFTLGSLLAHFLNLYIHNNFKSNFWKIPIATICVLLFLPMSPFIAFFYFTSSFIIYFDLTLDIFSISAGILGLDVVIISVLCFVFQKPFDWMINEIIILFSQILKKEIKYQAVVLFILIIVFSLLIKYVSKLLDWCIFSWKYDKESRKKSLNLIYVSKIALMTYIFSIITFTGSLGEIETDTINVITFITLIILLKDKLNTLFKKQTQEFKVQVELKNSVETKIEEKKSTEEETSAEVSDEPEEAIEEIVEKEEPVEQEEIKETIVEPQQIFYDSSTIMQPSYRYIRTHKLPDNRKIYRLRKERIGKIFLPK